MLPRDEYLTRKHCQFRMRNRTVCRLGLVLCLELGLVVVFPQSKPLHVGGTNALVVAVLCVVTEAEVVEDRVVKHTVMAVHARGHTASITHENVVVAGAMVSEDRFAELPFRVVVRFRGNSLLP